MVSDILPANFLEKRLRDLYAGRLKEKDIAERLKTVADIQKDILADFRELDKESREEILPEP